MFSRIPYGRCFERGWSWWLVAAAVALSVATEAAAQKFFPDDPIWIDFDNRNISTPKSQDLSDYYDFIENSFGRPGERRPRTAFNINTLGEAPDSSWFTNRHGRKRMSLEELARGPDRGTGPDSGPWKVLRGKNEGVTPGFRLIEDSPGSRYALKFDPRGSLEMASAAEIISNKFFYAFGYHVPEYYIVYFRPDQLELGPGATITDTLGRRRRMDGRDIQEVLNRVGRTDDGRYRASASKILAGEPVGKFRYYGTRPDDPNDVFPHEHRRELRGLWMFSAWLNHDDSRSINTLDMLVKEEGRQFIRHHLLDFGSTLGSGSVREQKPRAGNEYLWEPGIAFTRLFTFGFWDRPWILINYPEYPSIGKFEADRFRPENWKPEYPHPAFRNCLPEDGYWAAKIVMAFTAEDIRAIVKTGQISDPAAENYLIQCLIKRRDKIGRYWMNRVNPVDHFQIDPEGRLHFEDLAVRHGFAKPPAAYLVSWYRYDNQRDRKFLIGRPEEYAGSPLPIPGEVRGGPPGSYYTLQIRRRIEENPRIAKAVHLYFRQILNRLELVGIERDE